MAGAMTPSLDTILLNAIMTAATAAKPHAMKWTISTLADITVEKMDTVAEIPLKYQYRLQNCILWLPHANLPHRYKPNSPVQVQANSHRPQHEVQCMLMLQRQIKQAHQLRGIGTLKATTRPFRHPRCQANCRPHSQQTVHWLHQQIRTLMFLPVPGDQARH